MPTTRKRIARGAALPPEVIAVLGMGSGMNYYPAEWLREQWALWRVELTAYWQRKYGQEPFAAEVARSEGWPD